MKKLVQIRGKAVLVEEPDPPLLPGRILVRTAFSALSPGTEAERLRLASHLLRAARQRPREVKALLDFARARGITEAYRLASERLHEPLPLGYSLSGRILEVGQGVEGFNPGDPVACAGAQFAHHAEVVSVPHLMAARVPEGVGLPEASLATLGAIAFWTVKRAGVSAGETVAVIGLGIIGNLVAQIARASGARVFGLERDAFRARRGEDVGIPVGEPPGGADVVVVAAHDPEGALAALAGRMAGPRARVVFTGPWARAIPYKDFYLKELEILSVRAYGPGRYDPLYELLGVDYPPELSRWTIKRNMEAFLRLAEGGSLRLSELITHTFPLEKGPLAYDMAKGGGDFLGVLLEYPQGVQKPRVLTVGKTKPISSKIRVGLIGAGRFATSTIIPALKASGLADLVWIADHHNPGHLARRHGFSKACSEAGPVFSDPDTHAVFIATPHSSHASLALAALEAGKAVFVEKPLSVDREGLDALRGFLGKSPGYLMVDFNRRFSPMAQALKEAIAGRGPFQILIRVNPGPLPPGHWLHLETEGGRIVGEACHFIDLARFFAEGSITRVQSAFGDRDSALVSLWFSDGSAASVAYFSQGPDSMPKERIEVLGRGVGGVIDDFSEMILYTDRRTKRIKSKQDKGHRNIIRAFLGGLKSGAPPVSPEELLEVSEAALEAGRR